MFQGPEDEGPLLKKLKELPLTGGVVVPEPRPGEWSETKPNACKNYAVVTN